MYLGNHTTLGVRATFALALVATVTLIVLAAAAAPFVLFGIRAGDTERLMHVITGGAALTLFAFPLLLLGGALLSGLRRREALALWGRSLFVFPAAALAGYTTVTLLLLDYTPATIFAFGGGSLFAILFAWGELVLVQRALSAGPLPPNEADRC